MKSSQLQSNSQTPVVHRIRAPRSVAALFAAALAMGFAADSAMAQGNYYPEVLLLGGAPFQPNGFPVVSNFELNLIESKMPVTALGAGPTLVLPAFGLRTVATLAEYKAAVQAAATDVANGAVGNVTLASLAAEVAKYRQGPPSQVSAGLGAIATGIIASGSGTKPADLQALAFNAAKVDPVGATSGSTLSQALAAVAGNNTLVAQVGAMVSNALSGAMSGNPAPAALQSIGIKTLVADAVSAIANAPTANAATATPAQKGALISALATTVLPTISGSPTNIDQASAALLAAGVQPYVMPGSMALTLKASVPVSNANYGAIAQGGLRGNPGASAAIRTALSTPYTNDLIDAFNAFALPGNAGTLAGTYDPVAVSAAGATKFPGSAPSIVKDVLNASGASSTVAQDIIGRGIAAAIGTAPQLIASAAVGAGAATLGDVTRGATLAAPVGSAGAIAKAVAIAGTLTPATALSVATTAIAAAADASPTHRQDAYSDIAFNLAATGGNAAFQQAAVDTEVKAIAAANPGGSATAPTYIAVVSAAAGSPANRATILSYGTLAVAGDDDAASTAGVNLLAAFTNVPLNNYQATLNAVSTVGNDARNLAIIYAASLGNPGDTAGELAALIAKTGTSPADLTAAAISASRSRQTALTIAADVAVYAKANPTGNIQATIGLRILNNPLYAKEITAAATVVLPQFSHVIAHTLAFNQPRTAYDSVAGIFLHSRITNTVGAAGIDRLAIGNRPSAGAAITAGLTTGILEGILPATDRKLALQNVIVQAVSALVNPLYNDISGTPFQQSNGGVGLPGSSTTTATGVAGGITGFVAQLVNPGVNSMDSDTLNALFQASYAAGSLTGTTYTLAIAQAAGQAFGWVTGVATSGAGSVVANAIAKAIHDGYPGGLLQANILNAVNFGIDQAAGGAGVPGAGAGGLSNIPGQYYLHHSASGTPVSNIFTL